MLDLERYRLRCRVQEFGGLLKGKGSHDWRLAPPLRSDFELELQAPEPAAFAQLCGYWGLSSVDQSWRGFSIPGKEAHGVIASVRGILSRTASASDRITPAPAA